MENLKINDGMYAKISMMHPGLRTLWGVCSVAMFRKAFFTCSTGRGCWADTAAMVQLNW